MHRSVNSFRGNKQQGEQNNLHKSQSFSWNYVGGDGNGCQERFERKTMIKASDLISFRRTMHPIGYLIRDKFKCKRYSELQSGKILISMEFVSWNLAKNLLILGKPIGQEEWTTSLIAEVFQVKEPEKNVKKIENIFISGNYLINLYLASVKCFIYTSLFHWMQFTTCSEN